MAAHRENFPVARRKISRYRVKPQVQLRDRSPAESGLDVARCFAFDASPLCYDLVAPRCHPLLGVGAGTATHGVANWSGDGRRRGGPGAFTFWGERSATESALADYGEEQATIAKAAAGSVRASLEALPRVTDPAEKLPRIATRLRALQQPGDVIVLLRPAGTSSLLTLDGKPLRSAPLEARLRAGKADGTWVRLSHADSEEIGLPPRTAIAGSRSSTRMARGAGTW